MAIVTTITVAKVNATGSVTINANKVNAQYTGIVQVPVKISNNSDLLGFGFEISYDEKYLEPDSVSEGTLITGGTFDDSIGTVYSNPFRVIWNDTAPITTNGQLFVLKFKAKKSGNTTVTITGMKDDTYDSNYNKLESNVLNVDVTITCQHSYDEKIVQEATCTNAGLKEYKCKVCEYSYSEVLPALGHDYNSVVTNPTCKSKGYTTHTCSRCKDSYIDNYVNMTSHIFTVSQVDATCTSKGHKDYQCKNCDYGFSETIDALGHDYTTVVTNPTCTSKGYTTHTCSRCKDSYRDSYTDPTGHNLVKDEYINPTCTEEGHTEGYHCSKCGEVVVAQQVIPKKGHVYEFEVIAPTCTENGYTIYTCMYCKDSYTDNEVAALGHDVVVDPAKDATCTESGLTEGSHCSRCGKVLVEQHEVVAIGHVFGDYVSNNDATCDSDGTKTACCEFCDFTNTVVDEGSRLTHEYELIDKKEATETETGFETYKCKHCGVTYTKTIPMIETPTKEQSTTVSKVSNNQETTSKKEDEKTTANVVETTANVVETTTANQTVTNKINTKITSIKQKKKTLKIGWKKVTGIDGYEIQYSTSKSFKKPKKLIKRPNIKNVTVKKIKLKKKYYVRIRTFISENGKRIYSDWSKTKTKKTK